MDTLTKTEEIFSIFHDAVLSSPVGTYQKLSLTVECLHLAELIYANFDRFYIELYEIDLLEFYPWMEDNSNRVFLDIEKIFNEELEILHADINGDCVEISCNSYFNQSGYTGGLLKLSCIDIKLFDQNKNEFPLTKLINLANQSIGN